MEGTNTDDTDSLQAECGVLPLGVWRCNAICGTSFKDQECVASSCFHDSDVDLLLLVGCLLCHSVPPE